MGTERKRKVSLFDVVDDSAVKLLKSNGGGIPMMMNNGIANINRWNGRAYSQRYFDILEKRRSLPVWQQKEEFLKVLHTSQTIVLVGETGSGKTTQVSCRPFFLNLFYFSFSYLWLLKFGLFRKP